MFNGRVQRAGRKVEDGGWIRGGAAKILTQRHSRAVTLHVKRLAMLVECSGWELCSFIAGSTR